MYLKNVNYRYIHTFLHNKLAKNDKYDIMAL